MTCDLAIFLKDSFDNGLFKRESGCGSPYSRQIFLTWVNQDLQDGVLKVRACLALKFSGSVGSRVIIL